MRRFGCCAPGCRVNAAKKNGKFLGNQPGTRAFKLGRDWTLRTRLAIGRGPGIRPGTSVVTDAKNAPRPEAPPWYPGRRFGRQGTHPHRAPCLSRPLGCSVFVPSCPRCLGLRRPQSAAQGERGSARSVGGTGPPGGRRGGRERAESALQADAAGRHILAGNP
jgi:hypothetical protein